MTPESVKTAEIEPTKAIVESLRERYESAKLEPGIEKKIPVFSRVMETCGNPNVGLDQYLMGIVVAANKDIFAIVDVTAVFGPSDGYKPCTMIKTAITRHIPGGRAELVGFIDTDNKPKTIGRTPSNNYSKYTSRRHFSVSQGVDGSVNVADMHSEAGTELFTAVEDSEFGLNKGINPRDDTDNPIDDLTFWSVKSSLLREKLTETIPNNS